VLYLTYDYPQLSESYVHAEIRWMLSRGVDVEVYAHQRPLSRGEPIVPVHYQDLAGVVARFRPDVIHVHWLSLVRGYAPQLADFGVPVTAKGHGFDHTEELAAWLLAQPWLERMYLFGNLPQAGIRGRSKVRTCGAAVDTSRYYPVAQKDRNLVLRAGACLPTKDLGMFVEVAALCPEYHFTLALSSNDSGIETERRLRSRNAELGGPVEILTDVPYEPMAALMRRAAVYLHTFGFTQPFAQPVSVVEAMASGTVPLLRQADAVRAYAGDAAMYYDTAEDAARLLQQMRQWDEARWQAAQLACVEFAYAHHADAQVLEPMLHDWLALRGARPA
jgi:glycosyltransferase involved in cell wall biosynthesis